jgi:hypothetical protein
MSYVDLPKSTSKTIDELEKACIENGFTLQELFREAKEPVSTIQNWSRTEPVTLQKLSNLKTTLKGMVAAKRKPAKS